MLLAGLLPIHRAWQMPDIFLSYSRQDLAIAGKMAAALSAAGHHVWWDQALKSGEVYDQITESALREARVVIVLWSKAAVASDWVRSEATVAMQRGALMPVMIEACQRPVMFELRQSADLTGWKGNSKDPRLVAFLSDVAQQLAVSAKAALAKADSAPATVPKVGPNRRLLIGGAAGVSALAAGGFGLWMFRGGKPDDGTASVVVLPFANLSGDPAQAFFSDGIAEELRNALSQIGGLKVIGRVSSEQFRDTRDLSAVAEKLGVGHVLTGSFRRSPTTIRISAQLLEGRTGVESWSQSYDQPIGDVLAIQSKIATSVVATLSAKLSQIAGTIVVGGTSNPQAQELLLKGRKLYQADTGEAPARQYIAFLEAAVALDPDYAEAWAAMSIMKSNLRRFVTSAANRAGLQRDAMAASQRAISLAPNYGLARDALALQYLQTFDIRRALAEANAAAALAPANALVLIHVSGMLRGIEPDRAVMIARQAVTLDPLNLSYIDRYGRALNAARRYKEAAEAGRQAMALSNNLRGGIPLYSAQLAIGRIDAARETLRYIPDELDRLTATALIEARAGNRAASDAALAALRERGAESINYVFASAHAQRGEAEAALGALEISLQLRESSLTEIAVEPWFDPIRREPRFKAVQDAVIPPDLFVPPKQG